MRRSGVGRQGERQGAEDPAPWTGVTGLLDSSVQITLHAWVNNADWWQTQSDLMQAGKEALDEAGIEIPFRTRSRCRRRTPSSRGSSWPRWKTMRLRTDRPAEGRVTRAFRFRFRQYGGHGAVGASEPDRGQYRLRAGLRGG
ncbi:mechanosensitive ion channel family protein [Brevundimonas sp. LF-1]|uniref:mechanosensitive ion channel family protein n=1 Tax=Brevundimonas sp. LF-1 TaxID=3126100 RepID=UPI0030E11D25